MENLSDFIQTFLTTFLILSAISITLAIVLLVLAVNRVRKLDIPENADFTTTLLAIPIYVVLAIDLLDLGLDILAAPIVWVVLDHLKLRALRNFSSVEALIPFTGPIPTMTVAWVLVRMGIRF